MTPWVPALNADGDPATLEDAVFQALGSASMCWMPRPGDQVFQSEECELIGVGLIAWLRENWS